ncbi:MAG: adaptor protein MecA [Clostridia bacterium]|nr:adaptor protein MecA [Clostridia bacterium]
MELIRISDKKLKIMLTPTDMCHFELSADSFGKNPQKTRKTFRLLFEEIKKQTDFDADERHISVQYFPSREGGCEMFISRISDSEKETCAKGRAEERALTAREDARRSGSFRKLCVWRFETLDALLMVCKRIRQTQYIGESIAYRDETGFYFLLFSLRTSSPLEIPDEWCFLSEYGCPENASLFRLYISEHGRVICGANAVHTLAELA